MIELISSSFFVILFYLVLKKFFFCLTFKFQKSNVINSPDRGSIVRLNSVDKEMSGKYKCEVTIESQFFTINKEKHMEVVPPVVTTSTGK